ncbi:MAG TPA: hypothetical protein VMD56_02070 [Steroidobacteraceae bacterium]|nr:hypothetical protein [Steroidobacteraceae bacterium]
MSRLAVIVALAAIAAPLLLGGCAAQPAQCDARLRPINRLAAAPAAVPAGQRP